MRDGMTRKQRVLRDLRAASWRGFCAYTWYVQARPNDRNAPSEINKMPGFVVRSATCHEVDHPEVQAYARHFLDVDPEAKPRQLVIAI